jgi:hypothetical protein
MTNGILENDQCQATLYSFDVLGGIGLGQLRTVRQRHSAQPFSDRTCLSDPVASNINAGAQGSSGTLPVNASQKENYLIE